jgi:hypothetical protein
MSLSAGTGASQSRDSRAAGRDAALAALTNAGIDKADFAIVTAASSFDQQELAIGVKEALGTTPFVGCTGAGAILAEGVLEQAVAVLVLKSEEGKFIPIKVSGIGADMHGAGRKFGEELQKAGGGEVKLALIFSDALAGNSAELLRGILDVMGSHFPIGGGAAGDDLKFQKTYQYYCGEALSDALVGVGISGNIDIAVSADHGWQPIGIPRIATKAEGAKLIELDGKPAFSIYQDYFGERASDFKSALSLAAVSYPLGMKLKRSGDQIMIRSPLGVGEDGTITCGAEVVEGSEIYLMIGTLSGVLWSAQQTAASIAAKLSATSKWVVFVSDCVARKVLLGEHGMEEIKLLLAAGGSGTVLFGLYSYGQIAPRAAPTSGSPDYDPGFYEQSISLAAFGV